MAKPNFDNDISFDLLNEDTIARLRRDKMIEVPEKKVEVPKDKRWNEKTMASRILRGLQNGDSMQTISQSMLRVVGNNENSAIRNTRTMVTSAENHGRLDSYKNLSEQGLVMKKEWEATPDDRTRPSHIDIDGEEQDIDKPFSNGCMFPADGKGPAEEVWMCRCTMGAHIVGFRRADGSVLAVEKEQTRSLHDEQIEEERERRGADNNGDNNNQRGVVNGTDITGTWHRREKEFDFEIEDVINAQGFDGLPRVVDEKEFNQCVQEANDGNGFVCQRTYTAPTQEILDAYREQLYNGKFYVDCSDGGSYYGQGMYTSSNYQGDITKQMRLDMRNYSRSAGRPYHYIETMTLDPSARIITNRELEKVIREKGLWMDDPNCAATLLGYDAVRVNFDRTYSYTVVLNRTKLIIKKP